MDIRSEVLNPRERRENRFRKALGERFDEKKSRFFFDEIFDEKGDFRVIHGRIQIVAFAREREKKVRGNEEDLPVFSFVFENSVKSEGFYFFQRNFVEAHTRFFRI